MSNGENQLQPLSEQSRPKLARGVRRQLDPTSGEPMLLFPEGVLFLSSSADDIVTRCTGQQTISAIIASLAEEYEADPTVLRRDVLDCLQDLSHRKLVIF
jgi:coenzyme PQQ biosynthesis protein PqqD